MLQDTKLSVQGSIGQRTVLFPANQSGSRLRRLEGPFYDVDSESCRSDHDVVRFRGLRRFAISRSVIHPQQHRILC